MIRGIASAEGYRFCLSYLIAYGFQGIKALAAGRGD